MGNAPGVGIATSGITEAFTTERAVSFTKGFELFLSETNSVVIAAESFIWNTALIFIKAGRLPAQRVDFIEVVSSCHLS